MLWVPGLLVGAGAAVATAHGLYEITAAAGVPDPIAWLYPLITDGLALVAYAATPSLHGPAARYARSVVVLAAGLSGLAQAVYLVSGTSLAPPAVLRFVIGAWPAVAAAIVAHLLYLFATADLEVPAAPSTDTAPVDTAEPSAAAAPASGLPVAVQPEVFNPDSVQPDASAVQPFTAEPVQPGPSRSVQPMPAARPLLAPVERPDSQPGGSPARDRARAAAARHAQRHGALPTVSELESLAEVSRGTAAAALKALRDHPTPLHLITTDPEPDDLTIEERIQP